MFNIEFIENFDFFVRGRGGGGFIVLFVIFFFILKVYYINVELRVICFLLKIFIYILNLLEN